MKLSELHGKFSYIDDLMKKGIFTDADTGRPYFTGYDYRTLYDWDQYFEAIVQAYMGWDHALASNGITIFLDHQLESGHIARSVPHGGIHEFEHVKPFLAQTTLMIHRFYDDLSWFGDIYLEKMRKYLDYWLVDMDPGKTGLSAWKSAPHTGMDNQHDRAGWWEDMMSRGVDLNCYLVRECRAFSCLLEIKGKKDLAEYYRKEAETRKEIIQSLMWNEKDGFFYDIHTKSGRQIPVKSVSAFTTLWADVATKEQARLLVSEHLLNPSEFWSEYPVATLSKSEPGYSTRLLTREENKRIFSGFLKDFAPDSIENDLGCNWRANTWMPTNYMIFHGLHQYGYSQEAQSLVHRTKALLEKSGNREWYNSDTGEGCGLDPFWGWSLLGHFFEYEEMCEYDITELTSEVLEDIE